MAENKSTSTYDPLFDEYDKPAETSTYDSLFDKYDKPTSLIEKHDKPARIGKESETGLTYGRRYVNEKGNIARYIGEGQWQSVRAEKTYGIQQVKNPKYDPRVAVSPEYERKLYKTPRYLPTKVLTDVTAKEDENKVSTDFIPAYDYMKMVETKEGLKETITAPLNVLYESAMVATGLSLGGKVGRELLGSVTMGMSDLTRGLVKLGKATAKGVPKVYKAKRVEKALVRSPSNLPSSTIKRGELVTNDMADALKVHEMHQETRAALKAMGKDQRKGFWGKVYREVVDYSGGIKKELVERGKLGEDVIMRHNLSRGSGAEADRQMRAYDKTIFNLNKNESRIRDHIIQSRRTIAIHKYKPEHIRPKFLTGEQNANYLKYVQPIEKLDDVQMGRILKSVDNYFEAHRKNLDTLRMEGLLDDDSYKRLLDKGEFSPSEYIQHIDPVRTYNLPGGKTYSVHDSGLKKLDEGSANLLEQDSHKLLARSIAGVQGRVFRNKANIAAYELAEEMPDNGIFRLHELEAPGGFTKIHVMIKGKPKGMIVRDELAEQWVKSDPMIDFQFANMLQWASGARILKAMATGYNPEFAFSNFIRDMQHMWLATDEYSSFMPKAAAQFADDLRATRKDAWYRTGDYVDYTKEGGGMTYLTRQGQLGGEKFKALQDAAGYIGETSEIWTRLALRRRAILNKKTSEEATHVARTYIDFAQGGRTAKAIDTVFPYLNASIQGTRGIARGFKDRPVQTAIKATQLGLTSMSLRMANRAVHPWVMDQISDYEKSNYFIITTPWTEEDEDGNKLPLYFKFPKDQSQKIISTFYEAIGDKLMGKEVDADRLANEVEHGIKGLLPLVPGETLPPLLSMIYGYSQNRDFWRGEDIWKGAEVEAASQYYSWTPERHKLLGKAGLSPVKGGHAISQVFTKGNIWTDLVGGAVEEMVKAVGEEHRTGISEKLMKDYPGLRRFLNVARPYESEREAIGKEKLKVSTERVEVSRKINSLAKRNIKGDKSALVEFKTFLRTQPYDQRESFRKRFQNVKKIENKRWWYELKRMPPESRAKMFYRVYKDAPDKRKLLKQARQIDGFVVDKFIRKLNELKK